MAHTGTEGERYARFVVPLGIAVLVAVAIAAPFVSELTSYRLGVPGFSLALLLLFWAERVPGGRPLPAKERAGGLVLPRRAAYGLLLSLAGAVAASAFVAIATADRQMDNHGTYRGDPEILLMFAPLPAIASLLLLGGVVSGRGRVRLDPTGVSYVPLVGRRKVAQWDQVTEVLLLNRGTALRVNRKHGHLKIPMAGQRWPGEALASTIERYAATDTAERVGLVGSEAANPTPQRLPG